MLAAERHARILQHVERRERASVGELASALATSSATVRRDLSRLEDAGLLQRVHGGAVAARQALATPAATVEDEALARAVRSRLLPGDAVILAGQAVMPVVARQLASDPIRLIVVSNQLDIATTLLGKPGIEIILLGGKVHSAGYTLPQPLGASDLKFLVANKAFVEVEGVHLKAGITTNVAQDAQFQRDLLQHALHKTVVAPASRWGLAFTHRVALASEIDVWLTTGLDAAQRSEIAAFGAGVVTA
ncbi:MAG: DeoR/GlpR family DNA-binding transcription regulator [Vulcanimicrobiaceae bacterium]